MKKLLLILLAIVVIGGAVAAWIFLGAATGFSSKKEILYISSKAATREAVMDSIRRNKLVSNITAFEWLADRMQYWKAIRPGKYEFREGSSLLSIVRALRNGQQTPVNLTITKLRTREDLARLVGRRFETDSAAMISFLSSADSLRDFDLQPALVMTAVLPDTYTYLWTAGPRAIFTKMHAAAKKFWTEEKLQRAAAQGLSPQQVYTLASIIEEETNHDPEKGTIASVYLNRVRKGMPLQADPTVKFALKDFSLKRIYSKHTQVESPYNTYNNPGLPPGPICTPSRTTINAVLDAPQTDYFYFVASPAFDGTHVFTRTYPEHLAEAKKYQQALDARNIKANP